MPVLTASSAPTLRIGNVRKQQQKLLQEISALARQKVTDVTAMTELLNAIDRQVVAIERLCAQEHATPGHLPEPSRQAYAWMKFLTEPHNLQLHLQSTRLVARLVADILAGKDKRPRGFQTRKVSEEVDVEFRYMAGLFKAKLRPDRVSLAIHEGFICADRETLTAVVQAAITGKTPALTRTIKTFSLSEEFRELLFQMELTTASVAEQPRGRAYNLERVFEIVNRDYFGGQMKQPRLGWSRVHTTRTFGHYDPVRNRVILSQTLDQWH